MKNYKLVNNLVGWSTFVVAAITYLMTMEPTTSFWDCPEFIASAYKLQVGHPPGNPIFMLTANLFSRLASDTSQVAIMINTMSALFSALTILFLFWTITHLARKIVAPEGNHKGEGINLGQMIIIMGSGLIGALAYTFSDTFWFSAVEAEVYAYSSLMTALVFWLILKWENVADEPHSNRWLILIAYMIGLSIAVHLLNLLCIPAIVLVYYYKKYPNPNLKGSLIALLISFGLVAAILFGLVQGLVEVCGWFELLFVNVFGMPYNSGVIFYVILIFSLLVWSIRETMQPAPNELRVKISFILTVVLLGIPFIGSGYVLGIILIVALIGFMFWKKTNPMVLNTILVSLFVMTIGYSSYALIMIRSSANPPMDQNSPEDIFTLGGYLSREQYGDTPLLYGETYVSEVKREAEGNMCAPVTKDGGPVWTRIIKEKDTDRDRYFVSMRKTKYVNVDELNMIFPRMYSKDPRHIQAYKEWGNIEGKRVDFRNCIDPKRPNDSGETYTVKKPTFAENLRFFFNYQVNFMYWRYFMWNFSGRQNDIQGQGEVSNGNWITGIKFIDELMVGPQDDLPDDIAKNKGHNTYFMLPLLLGIIGLLYQSLFCGNKGIQGFWVVFFLFFMTGLAIVLYLNQTPLQVRERDYAYAGSFYAFSIWIGLGVAGISKLLTRYAKMNPVAAGVLATALCTFIPVRMAAENWDDHDRSRRFVARDFGYNYLVTCAPNAIIFTNGDNDTFPLWYGQEVEGFRTDVRVCNLSYLQTDWYIDQMKRQAYESEPLPISWTRAEYLQGRRDVAYIYEMMDKPVDVGQILDLIRSGDDRLSRMAGFKEQVDIIPSKRLSIPIDAEAVIRSGLVKEKNAGWIPEEFLINLGNKRYIAKHEMMILEMLRNNTDWERPIYYAVTVGSDQYLNMKDHFRQDGIAYRIMPYNAKEVDNTVGTEEMFDNIMNKYRWGNVADPKIYIDENAMRMCKTFRSLFGTLSDALINEGKNEQAEQVLDYSAEVLPHITVRYDYSALSLASGYMRLNQNEKALAIYDEIAAHSMRNLNWYFRLSPNHFKSVFAFIEQDLYVMREVLSALHQIDPTLAEKYLEEFSMYYSQYMKIMEYNQGQRQASPENR
ncbi:MAG: DUF2723 domain-containing protein [Dysgonamonadaceae bacterium]|jgi:MFS family permease|nr:DUF2723 domain-containing protein [Dysgonamonadaceae bacterium]